MCTQRSLENDHLSITVPSFVYYYQNTCLRMCFSIVYLYRSKDVFHFFPVKFQGVNSYSLDHLDHSTHPFVSKCIVYKTVLNRRENWIFTSLVCVRKRRRGTWFLCYNRQTEIQLACISVHGFHPFFVSESLICISTMAYWAGSNVVYHKNSCLATNVCVVLQRQQLQLRAVECRWALSHYSSGAPNILNISGHPVVRLKQASPPMVSFRYHRATGAWWQKIDMFSNAILRLQSRI